MTIYVDITQLEKGRANTGIQRVVKEFLKRASISKNITCKIIIFNEEQKQALLLDNQEVSCFLNDMKNYQFKTKEPVDIFSLKPNFPTTFFDIDSNWNIVLKRKELYPILKENGFLIFNFIYDLIPILFPHYAHEITAMNFQSFIKAVYEYSDLVMFDSQSAKNDFLNIKLQQNITRNIPTRVVGLGSDFLEIEEFPQDAKIQNILEKKYLLFVGTIEPRKNQAEVLEAFEQISLKYPDLNLVIIGKKGWKVDTLIQKILTHPLKDKQLFWLESIDDNTLKQFYKNAFIVTYLSKYEGYGLPIAESLSYGNITITSKNSSMYEVGRNAADYVMYDSLNELVSLISLYYDNHQLYKAKKQYIKNTFTTTSWELFYHSIENIFNHYEKSSLLKENHLEKLQFVFISIDKHNLEGTIKSIDKYINFVKEYIIVTQAKLVNEFKHIKSTNKITIIDENTLLKEHKNNFSLKDHQSKNWLLRASLLNIDSLEEEFIMLDDDNRPLKNITIEKFITKNGKYNAYYFYTLLDWHHTNTDYDKGQENTKELLSKENYELLSYSSHSPQIINKTIFKEAVEKFFDIGLKMPIDEWSTYFNYAVSLYPCLFNQKQYETLSWPATPTDWEYKFVPKTISFENYYKEQYDIGFFNKNDSYEEKLDKHNTRLNPYIISNEHFQNSRDILSKNNMVHTTLEYKTEDINLYVSNLPYFVVVEEDSDIKLQLNYKLLNPKQLNLDISLVIFLDGKYRTLRPLQTTNSVYQESIIEVPILSKNLHQNIYELSFNLMINNKYLYKKTSPYIMKLIVVKDKHINQILGDPQLLETAQPEELQQKTSVKNRLKAIPFLGWFLRWTNNLLRINNLKHTIVQQQSQIETIKQQLNTINAQIEKEVSKEILFQSLCFQQRIDQFIFDTKIKLNTKEGNKDILNMLENLPKAFIEEYSIAFENHFIGSREELLLRAKEYLPYISLNKIKKSLDISCAKAQLVELLQAQGIEAHGIDSNFSMIQEAQKHNIKNLHTKDTLEFLSSQESNSFDLVTAFHLIKQTPLEKLIVVLKEVKRVLKPNGQILLEIPTSKEISPATSTLYKYPTPLNPNPSEVIKFMLEFLQYKNIELKQLPPLEKKMKKNENSNSTSFKEQEYLITATNE